MSSAPEVPGYHVEGPIGFGAAGALWLARDSAGRARALRLLPPVSTARHAARLRRLRELCGLRHPNLGAVREIIEIGQDQAVVVSTAVPGPSLATLRAGRGGLPAAQTFGVVHEVCQALSALHSAGLAHGDIAPGNVLLCPDEQADTRAVLVDLAGEWAWDGGTAGFAAPEVLTGESAGPAADVYALARLALWLAAEEDRQKLRSVLAPALNADARRRPGVDTLAEIVGARERAGVSLPQASSLAAVSLREHAQRDLTQRKGSHRPRHRRRRPLLSASRAAGVAVFILAAAVVGLRGVADPVVQPVASDEGSEHAGGPDTDSRPAQLVLEAVDQLTSARDRALMDGDSQALAELSAPDSAARSADLALLHTLQQAQISIEDLHTDINGAQVVAVAQDEARVQVQLHQQPYRQIHPEAGATEVSAQQRCAVLTLSQHQGRWQVADSAAC